MKQRRLFARTLVSIVALIMTVMTVFAQTSTVKHIVARGETLEDIAKTYNVTKDEIISLNPSAGQFVYVGMELTIPQKPQPTYYNTTPLNNSGTDPRMGDYNKGIPDSANNSSSNNSSVSTEDNSFSYWGFGYLANFKTADKGYYGFFTRGIADYHFGMDFGMYANYGIVDKDYAGLEFLLGPAIGNKYDNVMASVALDACIATYSVINDEGKSKEKVGWGIALYPQLAFDLGDFNIVLGVYGGWTKGADEITLGFHAGLAF